MPMTMRNRQWRMRHMRRARVTVRVQTAVECVQCEHDLVEFRVLNAHA